nr:CSC1-like protein 2 isoform X2 [Odocoileus virginianus texanus]
MLPFLLATLGTMALNNSNPKDYCYSARIRSTVLQGLPFGGVPTVLALDFMCFLALLFLFSILRKVAWDYGRLALVTDADSVASAMHGDSHDRYERLTSVSSSVDFDQRDNVSVLPPASQHPLLRGTWAQQPWLQVMWSQGSMRWGLLPSKGDAHPRATR